MTMDARLRRPRPKFVDKDSVPPPLHPDASVLAAAMHRPPVKGFRGRRR